MTQIFSSYILLGGMKLNPTILSVLLRQTAYIILILFIAVNLSFGSALSKNCNGGPDCAKCAPLARSHAHPTHQDMQPVHKGMQNDGCQTADNASTCGFEAGRSPEELERIALAFRSDLHGFSGIIAAKSVVYKQSHPYGAFLIPIDSSDVNGTIPIYLLNNTLIC